MLLHQQTRLSGQVKSDHLRGPARGSGSFVRELTIPNIEKNPNGVHVVLCPGDYPNPIDAMGKYIKDPAMWTRYPFFPFICVRRQNPDGYRGPKYENRQDSIGFDSDNPQLSVFDYYINFDQEKVKNLSRAPKKAITVVGFTVQHQVPAIDDKGNVKHKQDGSVRYNYRECKRYNYGIQCAECNDPNKYPFSIGRKYYCSFGSGHFEDIENMSAMISGRCRCGGTITLMLLTCPKCNGIVADANRGLTDQQMNDQAGRVFHCYNCHYEGYPLEHTVRCTRCTTPQRMVITDRVLALARQVHKKESKIVLVNDWDINQYDLSGWRTTGKELVEKFGQPIDFDHTGDLRTLTLSEQADWLKLPVPEHLKQAAAQQDAMKKQSAGQAHASQPTVGNLAQPYNQMNQLGQPGTATQTGAPTQNVAPTTRKPMF